MIWSSSLVTVFFSSFVLVGVEMERILARELIGLLVDLVAREVESP